MLKNFYRKYRSVRNLFWNLRAGQINRKWGDETGDYETLRKVITYTKSKKILDIGCGSGRLFPLFDSLGIENVVGQDISPKAIRIAEQKYHNTTYTLLCCDIVDLNFEKKYFDLVISNRCLSAVPPNNISATINKLCALTNYIYLNEFADLDEGNESFYWYRHDYQSYFIKNNFQTIERSETGGKKEEGVLFKRVN